MSSLCASRKSRHEDEHGVGEGAEHGEEEAADDAGPQDLQQQLAAVGQVRGRQEHEAPVDDDQEQVAGPRGGAGQEPVRLLARRRGFGVGGGGPQELQVGRAGAAAAAAAPDVDSIGDGIGRPGPEEGAGMDGAAEA